ncbi:hypothetical protein Vadar_023075 [Vaccinium darrowii]|uniref:Uncharacterized protein n=1 Tax=Vaccinium darrowii TaxID=229202 RepID=A0ACB7YYM5_9ERIC|nr:hypothetical protein Vadar_023075 [Vaccinium darrowii]
MGESQWSCPAIKDNSPNFCRLIVSTSTREKLRIPGKFVKKLGNELPNVATLITPHGCISHVRLEKIDGKFCFTDGWNEFVKHQSIGAESLLIFSYLGNSILRVNIYDISKAEINYRCKAHRGLSCGYRQAPVKEEVEEDDCIEILDPVPFPQHQTPTSLENNGADSVSKAEANSVKGDELHITKNLGKAPVPCVLRGFREPSCGWGKPVDKEVEDDNSVEIPDSPCPSQTPTCRENKEADRVFEETAKARGAGISNSPSPLSHEAKRIKQLSELMTSETRLNQRTKRKILDECEDSAQEKVSKSPTAGAETSLRRSRAVTPQERVRVQNISRMFRSENPFCRVSLRPSYVYEGSSLHIASSFADRYLAGVSRFITSTVSTGEQWPIKCTWVNGSAMLTTGWHQFVLDNRLEEGDVCIFELIKMVDIVLKVTIVRVNMVVPDAEQPVPIVRVNMVVPDAEQPVPESKKRNENMKNSEPACRVTTRSKSAKSVSS